jgi:hypothetical protein
MRHYRRVSQVIGRKPSLTLCRFPDQFVTDALNDLEIPSIGGLKELHRLASSLWRVGAIHKIVDRLI